jgi:hypothetical protein
MLDITDNNCLKCLKNRQIRLWEQDAAGSNPVTRTIFKSQNRWVLALFVCFMNFEKILLATC